MKCDTPVGVIDFGRHMEAVAQHLLGEPNKRLSTPNELRFGTHGSLSVDLEKGRWFDHEANIGGGVLGLIQRETGLPVAGGAAMIWLRENILGAGDATPVRPGGLKCEVATYRYEDEAGTHLFDVVRYEPKDFRQRAADGSRTVKGVRKVLYRLPRLAAAPAGSLVYLVEGEKDVHRLEAEGLLATTNPGGAGKWREDYSAALTGKNVVILHDNDEAGRAHAEKVQASLTAAGVSCTVLQLDGLPEKGDVSDWLDQGHTGDELDKLAARQGAEGGQKGTDGTKPRAQFRGLETAAEFARRWSPPTYIVDGILARRRVQAITAYTGHTKTTTVIFLALCVATGQPFGSADTEQGAVLILAGENPDLVVGQFLAACRAKNLDPAKLPIYFHYGRFSIAKHRDVLMQQASEIPNLALIIPDTHQAFFEGTDDNSNMDALANADKWRVFAEELSTHPTVLIPAHPSGKSPDRNNLVPRGGSAFMNELDGNFCLWRKDDVVSFHWQGKHRGPIFEPLDLKLDLKTHPEIVDSKGREIPMPVIRPLMAMEASAAVREDENTTHKALVAIRDNPKITVRELATAIGKGRSRANDVLAELIAEKLVKRRAKKLQLTTDGREILDDAGL